MSMCVPVAVCVFMYVCVCLSFFWLVIKGRCIPDMLLLPRHSLLLSLALSHCLPVFLPFRFKFLCHCLTLGSPGLLWPTRI